MPIARVELDVLTLRRMLRAGGLDVGSTRAERILPIARVLLECSDRLAALDLDQSGGAGIERAPDDPA